MLDRSYDRPTGRRPTFSGFQVEDILFDFFFFFIEFSRIREKKIGESSEGEIDLLKYIRENGRGRCESVSGGPAGPGQGLQGAGGKMKIGLFWKNYRFWVCNFFR